MVFEALTYIDRLKQAGVDEAVARAHAQALRTALGETVATKQDIKDLQAATTAEFVSVRAEMKLTEQRLLLPGYAG